MLHCAARDYGSASRRTPPWRQELALVWRQLELPTVVLVDARQGMQQLRNADSGAGARRRHRQGHPHHGTAGVGAGQQIRGSLTPVSTGTDLCARGSGDTAIDTGRLGRHVRRATATAGRRAPSGNPATGCTARRRDNKRKDPFDLVLGQSGQGVFVSTCRLEAFSGCTATPDGVPHYDASVVAIKRVGRDSQLCAAEHNAEHSYEPCSSPFNARKSRTEIREEYRAARERTTQGDHP